LTIIVGSSLIANLLQKLAASYLTILCIGFDET